MGSAGVKDYDKYLKMHVLEMLHQFLSFKQLKRS